MKKIFIEKEILEHIYKTLRNQKKVAKYFNVSLKVIKRLVKEYDLQKYDKVDRIKKPEKLELYNLICI